MINIPKGTKDVLPTESYKWQYVESKAREICNLYNAREIRTPVFEHTELFLRSIGETTDVVGKEMYTFLDKADRSITLKPEGTAGVARSYVENNLSDLSLPLKLFYITPVFRYENPQHGRLREHHQFGVEFYGSGSYMMDFEVIALARNFLVNLGVNQLRLEINSIGCPECRKQYNSALKEYLSSHLEEMCPTCRERFNKNPLRILDCKNDKCKQIVEKAPLISDYLCDDCKEHFHGLKTMLDKVSIEYNVNPRIVRGLDYYTRTVFEFITTALGTQGTICGGGRYDGLVSQIGGAPTPCVGFGLGIERLLMLMDSLGIEIPKKYPQCYVAAIKQEYALDAYLLAKELRSNGISADFDTMGKSLKSQLKYADKIGAEYIVVLGDEEIATKKVTVKRMKDGEKLLIDTEKLSEVIKRGF